MFDDRRTSSLEKLAIDMVLKLRMADYSALAEKHSEARTSKISLFFARDERQAHRADTEFRSEARA